ncbi:MAG: PEP-CTERM sorting domain-containing protein [Planctomycetota bacterium]
MNRFSMKALVGTALLGLAAAPASADLTYYWDISALGIGGPAGTVSNDLSIVTDNAGFTAVLLAELTNGSFYNPNASNVPPGGASADSYFGGGFNTADSNTTPSPILVGKAVDLGGNPLAEGIGATVINQTWIPDFNRLTNSGTAFPTGTVAAPAFGGRFSASSDATGTYQIRLNNENGDLVQVLNGTISNGRFSQRLAGDVNLDGDVDIFQAGGQGDIQIVLANLGTGDSLLTGDANGDDDVDIFQAGGQGDIQIVLANIGGSPAGAATRSSGASATYDRETGELTFDILAPGTVQIVGLTSVGNFDTNATPGSLTLFNGAVSTTDAHLQFDEDTIAYFFGANNFYDAGSFEIGAVLATGLTENDLNFEYTDASGATVSGQVIVVPEPGSLALLGLGGLALIRRRRAA